MKALVTGGAGFIGSHLADRLLKTGTEVTIVDDLSSGKRENIPEGAEFVLGDISDISLYANLPSVDVIFHNAASKKNVCLRSPVRDLEVNGGGTLRLLQFARKTKVKKFVHASTGSVYGNVDTEITEETTTNPVSYYGISKLAGENYVRYFNYAYGLDTTILRYFHVYGDRQEYDPYLGGVVAIFKHLISEDKPITVHGSGDQQRVFTHVEDIVNANITVWQNPRTYCQVYNCASDREVTINELAHKLGAKKIQYGDMLEGDIFWFDVNSEKIKSLGVKFRGYE